MSPNDDSRRLGPPSPAFTLILRDLRYGPVTCHRRRVGGIHVVMALLQEVAAGHGRGCMREKKKMNVSWQYGTNKYKHVN